MPETVKVNLKRAATGHEGEVRILEFREPTWDIIMRYGDPYTVHTGAGGAPVVIMNDEAIKQYAEHCLIKPSDPSILVQLRTADTNQVRNAIVSFFLPADEVSGDSKTSPKASSSNSDGAPTPLAG